MNGFEDIRLTWDGEDYVVRSNQVFDLVLQVETIIMNGGRKPAFMLLLNREAPFSVLSKAYATALRYAGASVTNEEVFLALDRGLAEGDTMALEMIIHSSLGILEIISPSFVRSTKGSEEKGKK